MTVGQLNSRGVAARTLSIRVLGKRILIYLLLTFIGVCGGVAAFEIYARFAIQREPRWIDRWSFRATQPPPYAGASYFSQAFIQEASHSVVDLRVVPGKNQLILPDFQGQWSNVRDGRRVTTDQPPTFQNHIYLIGASCVFCAEVPDGFTLPSYLQRKVNTAMPGRYRVENLGVPAVTSAQELEALKGLRLEAGDIVIFYDGANDITYGVYYLVPLGLGTGRDISIVKQMSLFEKVVLERFSRWKPKLASLRLLEGRIDLRPPPHLVDGATVKALLELMARQRTSALLEAHSVVESARGEFFSFAQPNIWDLPTQTEYRKSIIVNPLSTPPGLELAFRPAAPIMARVASSLETAGVKAADLAGVLTSISNGEEVFLDYAHVNHRANEEIANELFEQVFRKKWPTPVPGAENALRESLGRLDVDALAAPTGGAWDCDFFRREHRVYAVPKKYGYVWWNGLDVAALPGVVSGTTLDEVARRVRLMPVKRH
jgi:hypothetical protein